MIEYHDQGQDNTWPLRMIPKGGKVLGQPAVNAEPSIRHDPAASIESVAPAESIADAMRKDGGQIGHGGASALEHPAAVTGGARLNYERIVDVFIPGSVPKVPTDMPLRPTDFMDAYELRQEFRKAYEEAVLEPAAKDGATEQDTHPEDGTDAKKEGGGAPVPDSKVAIRDTIRLHPSDTVKEIMRQREMEDMDYPDDGPHVL